MDDAYTRLAHAIVVLAAEDYRKALRDLSRNPDYKPALNTKAECEQFFQSEWFRLLTPLDGPMIMKRLQEEVM